MGIESISDITNSAQDVGSSVDQSGAEFANTSSFTDFDIPVADVPAVGGYDQVGSFAGDAGWFDAYNPGEIVKSATPSSSGGFFDSITKSLPSVADIKKTASSLQSDFSGFVKQAQTAAQTYQQKFAPQVNAAASALGIRSQVDKITQPVTQGIGIASTAAAATDKLNTSLATQGAAPVKDASGLTILDAAGTAEVTKGINPAFVNSLVDPGTGPATPSYDTAVATNKDLKDRVANLDDEIVGANARIASEKERLAAAVTQLDNPNLSETERKALQAEVDTSNRLISQYTTEKDAFQKDFTAASADLAKSNEVIAKTDATTTAAPAAVAPATMGTAVVDQYAFVKNTDGTYSIIDKATGDTVESGLSEQQAILRQQDLNTATPGITASTNAPVKEGFLTSITGAITRALGIGTAAGANAQALATQLRDQNAIRALRQTKAQSSDWRVRLRLAPSSNYLYNDTNPGDIMYPLRVTDGVIFPYTPSIETAYKANYSPYDLTHSNFRGYFYQNSFVDAVNVRCTFTAQDTEEANYLLATIHFFRSVTKMFYGQDAQRGSPPPLVYLTGLGDYQFQEHPCVVSQFNYTLPPDVDYIRAGSAIDNGTNFLANRTRTTIASNPISYSINRLLNNSLTLGAQPNPLAPGNLPVGTPTYVPTKMEISLSLLPMQSRQQVSTQFSLKAFSNGNLLKGGFW